MSLEAVSDNEALIRRLSQTIRSGKLFHGYILEGDAADTWELAYWLIRASLCQQQDGNACGVCPSCRKIQDGNSEDVFFVGVPGESVKDRDVEDMIARVMQKSYTGNRLFLVIRSGDSMTLRAQNRLLKTLEEPPGEVTILILAENSQSLAETIRSRCQLLKLHSDGIRASGTEDEEFQERAVETAAAVILGKPAFQLWNDIEYFSSGKQAAAAFLSVAETLFRDILVAEYDPEGVLQINRRFGDLIQQCRRRVSPAAAAAAIQCAETAARDLGQNVSAGHAVKYMIFDIQEKLNDNSNRRQI